MITREFELGSIHGLPEVRITMNDSVPVPMPVVQIRSTTIHVFVVINQLEDVGEDFWNAVRDCAMLAGTGAAIAGFFLEVWQQFLLLCSYLVPVQHRRELI